MLKISIITATFNAAATLPDCLDSVAQQSYGDIEHIVIDGGSTDATVNIAGSYHHVRQIVSESDNGIYDAMNKGLGLAAGDIIGILNADDYYATPDILAKVAAVCNDPAIEACYGDLLYVNGVNTEKVVRSWKSGSFNPRKFYWGWMPPHPTFFVRRSVYQRFGGFNLDLGSAADYELMLRFLLRYKLKAAYIPEVLVKMRTGGVSNSSILNRLKANRMDRKAWEVNGMKPYPWTLPLKPLRKIGQWLVK